ncbi:hypothetical protein [Rugamonas rubra]|uniref:hypothetical protein n=1 Tax=Rugamonas rubra TaxID=758825 RepID=UPI001114303B|nr:hypothetical protein [Rugamonas rubra]
MQYPQCCRRTLVGQERLCEQRARFQESGDTHIVKRFMVETLRFRGVRSAVDAATCLKSYDGHAYPVGSDWSFTRYYYLHAFEAGLRLETSADFLWDAFSQAHQHAGLVGTVEIPMGYFSRAVEAILLDGGCAMRLTFNWPRAIGSRSSSIVAMSPRSKLSSAMRADWDAEAHVMALPLLIVPACGVKVVTLPKLASHLFATYESAWALAAKLAAANALSA